MKKVLLLLLLFPNLFFAQATEPKKKLVWAGAAMMWNLPQDLFGFEAKTTFEGKVKEEKYWNNYFSIGAVYGHKLFESGIFSELPENRIESEVTLNLLFGRGHQFDNSILIFKTGLAANEMSWRGKETGSTCNSFFCLGKYHRFAYDEIFRLGLTFETEYLWQLGKHIGMGVSIFVQAHPSYNIENSMYNNNYMEGGISFFLFHFGRFEH